MKQEASNVIASKAWQTGIGAVREPPLQSADVINDKTCGTVNTEILHKTRKRYVESGKSNKSLQLTARHRRFTSLILLAWVL